jgi:hypothetical protein
MQRKRVKPSFEWISPEELFVTELHELIKNLRDVSAALIATLERDFPSLTRPKQTKRPRKESSK